MLKKIKRILHEKKEPLLAFAQEFKDVEHNYKDLSPSFLFGLFLIFISFVIGWGGPLIALWYGITHSTIAVPALIGTLTYGLGWILTPIGLAITAKQNIYYLRYFTAKFILRVYNPLDRHSVMEIITPLFIAALIILWSIFKWSTPFQLSLVILIGIHQILLVISLLVPNIQLLSRTACGKDIELLKLLYPDEQLIRLVTYWKTCRFIFRFDDGVDPDLTPDILRILEREGAYAIFAITGRHAEQHPDLVRAVAERGHLIVNHSYSHPNLFSLLRESKLQEEMVKTNRILQDLTGKEIHFFAPPIGHSNIFLRKTLHLQKMTALGWDVNSHDVLHRSEFQKQRFLASLLTAPQPAIVLFHDGLYAPGISHKAQTLELVEQVFALQKRASAL